MKHLTTTFDIENITFRIMKATPRFDRMTITRDGSNIYKLTITSDEKNEMLHCPICSHHPIKFISMALNHEFLHVILGEFVSTRAFYNYDKLLILLGIYYNSSMSDDWL